MRPSYPPLKPLSRADFIRHAAWFLVNSLLAVFYESMGEVVNGHVPRWSTAIWFTGSCVYAYLAYQHIAILVLMCRYERERVLRENEALERENER